MATSGRRDPFHSPVRNGCVDRIGPAPPADSASPREVARRCRKKERVMQQVRGFGRFWWDFIIGDDPALAVGVVLVLALARTANQNGLDSVAWVIGPIGVMAVLGLSLWRAVSAE